MQNKIVFRPNEKALIDGLCYFAVKNNNKLGVHQAMKLLFFSDVAHMNKFLLPVFGGVYKALRFGPINQDGLNIINNTFAGLEDGQKPLPLKRTNNVIDFKIVNDNKLGSFLSKNAKHVLDETWNKYGNMDFMALTEESHKHKAWQKAWGNKSSNSPEMDYIDFYGEKISPKIIKEIIEKSATIAI
ncbi:MAG: Panacea domain-containing protein [Hydrotalea sp.]|nr:Panacea domain-containing protein [Hydrotalea sp.]